MSNIPSKNETLLTELKAWMASDAGRKFACVRNYPFLDKKHDAHCEGCLIVASVKALSGDSSAPETQTRLPGWKSVDAFKLARQFHEVYERLAPSFGYETRKETRAFDPHSPNGRLMIAVCRELIEPPAVETSDSGSRPQTCDVQVLQGSGVSEIPIQRVVNAAGTAAYDVPQIIEVNEDGSPVNGKGD